MSLLALVKGKGASGFGYGSTALQVTEGLSLEGRTFLVTGSTSGLGRETVRVLAKRGARVLATGRSVEKASRATQGLGHEVVPLACELAEPASVRDCVRQIRENGEHLDGIVCNAGIMALPKLTQSHGLELQFLTNHIGHFMLVTGLVDCLSSRARVVMLSSAAHTMAPREGIQFDNLSGARGYNPWRAYGQSKLANLLFSKELARRWVGTGKTANAVHPGVIRSELQRSMPLVARVTMDLAGPLALKSIPEGAATQCFVATHPSLREVSGEYFADCNRAPSNRLSRDPQLAARLWEVSERLVAGLT
jgi:NAD(P)-dependent dehydrogenase (short-subunit alcohol dehydrogenase family)